MLQVPGYQLLSTVSHCLLHEFLNIFCVLPLYSDQEGRWESQRGPGKTVTRSQSGKNTLNSVFNGAFWCILHFWATAGPPNVARLRKNFSLPPFDGSGRPTQSYLCTLSEILYAVLQAQCCSRVFAQAGDSATFINTSLRCFAYATV